MSALDETAVLSAVFSFLRPTPCETLVVAFSGGPDSTALLWALRRASRKLEDESRPRIVAAHLDHGLDPESAHRADAAADLARRLGLSSADLRLGTLPSPSDDEAADGLEDWARRRRYEWLARVAREEAADVVLTAHHADDQAETVTLRLLYGSGLRGLSGVRPERDLVHGVRLQRPLLSTRRAELDAALDVARQELPDLEPLHDPTNFDAQQPRAFVRGHLLPHLESESPGAVESLIRVADAARRFRAHLDERLDRLLAPAPRPASRYDFLQPPRRAVALDAFRALPAELRPYALTLLHARLGQALSPPQSAVRELERQLGVMSATKAAVGATGVALGVDCGDGLRWSVQSCADRTQRSAVLQLEQRIPPRPFTYTFDAPGTTPVPEIFVSLHLRLRGGPAIEPWMLCGEVLRTGLSLPRGSRPVATVRSRRPGDRLRPLGASGRRKLKDLLIDRKVPRSVRDRLPLLVLDGILAWVPGVTVHERFRLPPDESNDEREIWIAEIRLESPDTLDDTAGDNTAEDST